MQQRLAFKVFSPKQYRSFGVTIGCIASVTTLNKVADRALRDSRRIRAVYLKENHSMLNSPLWTKSGMRRCPGPRRP
jgi:hypothetical protein